MSAFIAEYWPYAAALLPTVGVVFLFYWIIRYMIEADRSERKAIARWNKEHGDELRGDRGPVAPTQRPGEDSSKNMNSDDS